ncbi:origin recognition complex subunit 2-like [Peromyscus californicus insignis]|uniref:origin recognition complex subunit 2-like n=1 Tax=Peromyscus californicus insignis TaxID=564181 RepID=UPI0022A689C0|nr:origin recognition complex subunit 2-like [Peromyscus californicus insignis]
MMNTLQLKEAKVLDVQFVGDDDVRNHIFDREGGTKLKKEKAQLLVNPQKIIKKPERELEKSDQEVFKDQNYVEVLGRNIQESLKNGSSVDSGNKVYSFQHRKHSEEMAKLALELAKKPRKIVPVNSKNVPEIMKNAQKSKGHSTSEKVQLENNNKTEFLSTPPRSLRKRIIVPTSHCDSESEYSASDWLWYEPMTYNPYSEETSYENSILVKQSGSLPLSSLIHVLRSLTPNVRTCFSRLLPAMSGGIPREQ